MDENLIPADYRDIPGWTDFESVYQRAVDEVPLGGTLVEIGSWMGRSAAMMCTFLERAGKAGGARFYCVDTWKGAPECRVQQQLVAEAGGNMFDTFDRNMAPWRGRYIPLQMDSVEAAKQFADASVDFVFVDGGHTKEQVLADLAAWLPKVRSGGLLAGHDIGWPEVRAAVSTLPGFVEVWAENSWVYRVP